VILGSKNSSENSQQVFRQFAWNLAGTLAKPAGQVQKPRPAVKR
jgi:hypothetical protein